MVFVLIAFIYFSREMLTVDWIVFGRRRKLKSDNSRAKRENMIGF
jgi:hypothetical protein